MSVRLMRSEPTAEQVEAQRHAAKYASSTVLGIPWYRHFPGNNLRISRGWPVAVLGTYHALRDAQWDRGYLPSDPEEVRRVVGVHSREWRVAWPLVWEHFPVEDDGNRRNRELAEERHQSIGRRWQKLDASRSRFAGWYRGKSADDYHAENCLPRPSSDASRDLSGDTSHHHHHHLKTACDEKDCSSPTYEYLWSDGV